MTNNRRTSGASSQGNIFALAQVCEHAETDYRFLENLMEMEGIKTPQLDYKLLNLLLLK